MRHQYIEENQIVDRYLMDQLPAQEREDFEDHYLHCELCQDDLQAARALHSGLKTAAARGWLQSSAAQESEGAGRARRSVPLWTLAAAAALAGLLLLPPVFLWIQMDAVDGQLAQTRQELELARENAQERAAETGKLTQELQDLRNQQGQDETRLQEQLTEERRQRQQLAADLGRLRRPQINTPVIPLDALRGSASSGDATVIRAAQDSAWIVLALLPERTDFDRYRVQLRRDDRTVWQSDGLLLNYRDELVVNLPVDMLREGAYQVSLEGVREDASRQSLSRYAFTFKP